MNRDWFETRESIPENELCRVSWINMMVKFKKRKHESPGLSDIKKGHEFVDFALEVLESPLLISQYETIPNLLVKSKFTFEKSAVKSETERNLGNEMLLAHNFTKAYEHYTRSIAFAPNNSEALAFAYGNRSLVLFKLGLFKECFKDIERALTDTYPMDKRQKLIERQSKAKAAFGNQVNIPHLEECSKIKYKNSELSEASNCIKIEKNREFGRHVVATREISPGHVLLVENPCVIFTKKGTELMWPCSECSKFCFDIIPCENCSLQLYCSRECRRKAFINYHRYECVILRYIDRWDINVIALRMTIIGFKEYGTQDKNSIYHKCSELFANERYTINDKSESIYFLRAANAAKIFYVLKNYTDFFSEFDIDDKENAFKRLLLQNYLGVTIYMIKICSSYSNEDVCFATGIYPGVSMFNHSCNENVMSFFYGTTMVLKAKKRIKSGEQCFINYGANTLLRSTIERQAYLKERYEFLCRCRACTEGWPKRENLTLQTTKLVKELSNILNELMNKFNVMDRQRKDFLLQKTFKISEMLESKYPVILYDLTTNIYNILLAEAHHSFDSLIVQIEKNMRNL